LPIEGTTDYRKPQGVYYLNLQDFHSYQLSVSHNIKKFNTRKPYYRNNSTSVYGTAKS